MADIAALNRVALGNIGAVNKVNYGNIAAINKVPLASGVADSISLNPDFGNWLGSTEAGVTKNFDVTASGSWTASVTSDPNSIVTGYQASGTGSETVGITLDNPAAKGERYAEITFTRGTAFYAMPLCISGIISGVCPVP